ncbi:MAG: nucleotidyltransferase family protein [bacterium]
MTIEDIKKKVKPFLLEGGVKKAGLFGSVAKGLEREDSDVDILVEFGKENLSLLEFIGLKQALEEALGKKVDLVEYTTIKPLLRTRILAEEISIL